MTTVTPPIVPPQAAVDAAVEAQVQTFWQKHKKTILVIVALLLAFGGGFGTALRVGPAKIVTKLQTKTQVVTQTQIQYKDRIVTQKVYVQVEKKHDHTETTTTKQPDGTVVTKVVEDVNTDTQDKADTSVDNNANKSTVAKTDTQSATKEEKIVSNKKPDWGVYAGVGLSIPHYLGHQDVGVPGLQGFVIQAGVDRHIIGPFWLGLFGNSQGTVGLNLRGEL